MYNAAPSVCIGTCDFIVNTRVLHFKYYRYIIYYKLCHLSAVSDCQLKRMSQLIWQMLLLFLAYSAEQSLGDAYYN